MWDGSVLFKLVSVRSEKHIFAPPSLRSFPTVACPVRSIVDQFDVASKGAKIMYQNGPTMEIKRLVLHLTLKTKIQYVLWNKFVNIDFLG